MRLRKLRSSGDYLWGLSHLSMYFDAVSSGENGELGHLCNFLKSKYLHCKETTFSSGEPSGEERRTQISTSRLVMAFSDYDFEKEEDFWKSDASYDRDACRNFGEYVRTNFPRRASLSFSPTGNFQDLNLISKFDSEAPAKFFDVPSFEAGVLCISFIRSPEVVQQFNFITAYETPRHQEVFKEILQGERARYGGHAFFEYQQKKNSTPQSNQTHTKHNPY